MGILELGSPLPAPLLASLVDHLASGEDCHAGEDVRRNLAGIGALIDLLRPNMEAARAELRRLKRRRQTAESAALEANIPRLLESERLLAADREHVLSLLKAFRTKASAQVPDLEVNVREISIALDDLLVTWLESLRDLRWEAMLILAGRELREEGCILDTPEKVRAWAASAEDGN